MFASGVGSFVGKNIVVGVCIVMLSVLKNVEIRANVEEKNHSSCKMTKKYQ